jgi:ppGpp synthetase/RelA/SpoT-type nucleotidyltranferase
MQNQKRYLAHNAEERLLEKLGAWLPAQKQAEIILNKFLNDYRDTFSYHVLLDPRPTRKSFDRCVQKVISYVDNKKANNEIDAINNCLKDIAGVRFIVLYPSDRDIAVQRFRSFVGKFGGKNADDLPHFELDGEPEIKNYDTGYKAVHQGMKIQMEDGESFPVEIQFMNVLQHMWDKIQGPLYREPTRYPASLHTKVKNLSEACEKVSEKADKILIEMQSHHHRVSR